MNHALVSQSPCSGFGDARLRVVEAYSPDEFKSFSDLTPQQLHDNKELDEMRHYDKTSYLARYGGLPGLVRGVSQYANSSKVFTPDLKYFTRLCSSRVVENKIKFNYGSEQVVFPRSECWEHCVKRIKSSVIIERRTANAQTLPFEILREGDTKCPICLDDLSGNVVHCSNNHQIDLACFELLPLQGGVKKCPTCRSPYSNQMLERVQLMRGAITLSPGILTISVGGGNSSLAYNNAEALFLGIMRQMCNASYFDCDERILISAFFNWYSKHPERFSSYNFNILTQKDTAQGLQWSIEPNIEYNNAFLTFIEEIHSPDIYQDVAFTNHYFYDYNEERFNEDLEALEGANTWRRNKEFPGTKKEFLKREIYFRTFTRVNDRDNIIKRFEKIIKKIIKSASNNMLDANIINVP